MVKKIKKVSHKNVTVFISVACRAGAVTVPSGAEFSADAIERNFWWSLSPPFSLKPVYLLHLSQKYIAD